MTRTDDVPPAGRVPVVCWRCGADCTTTHKTIHDLGRDTHVCAAGCVPTITKETP